MFVVCLLFVCCLFVACLLLVCCLFVARMFVEDQEVEPKRGTNCCSREGPSGLEALKKSPACLGLSAITRKPHPQPSTVKLTTRQIENTKSYIM